MYTKLGMFQCILNYQGVEDHNYFTNTIVILSLKIIFGLANRADPYEMLHAAAFHLELPCLPKYLYKR